MKKLPTSSVVPAGKGESGGTGDAKMDTSNELDPASMVSVNRVKSKSRSFVGGKKMAQAIHAGPAAKARYERAMRAGRSPD